MRRQLSLFLTDKNREIERIRSEFNPLQFELIAAHVTLCRENEIEEIDNVIRNIRKISLSKPLQMKFGQVERFDNGKSLLIPAKKRNDYFQHLRSMILQDILDFNKHYLPHITLMHPRNSTCTDEIFDQIKKIKLPSIISFDTISLIEQTEGNPWAIIEQYPIVSAKG